MNRWNIPKEPEEEVRARDTHCVYCGISLEPAPGKASIASWEHIINDINKRPPENIARCCRPCNSSKGRRL
jgi:5-methylcytosine-specific restriction endonuclease McrA